MRRDRRDRWPAALVLTLVLTVIGELALLVWVHAVLVASALGSAGSADAVSTLRVRSSGAVASGLLSLAAALGCARLLVWQDLPGPRVRRLAGASALAAGLVLVAFAAAQRVGPIGLAVQVVSLAVGSGVGVWLGCRSVEADPPASAEQLSVTHEPAHSPPAPPRSGWGRPGI